MRHKNILPAFALAAAAGFSGATQSQPDIPCRSYAVLDPAGNLVMGQNADQPDLPASTAKLMTALIAQALIDTGDIHLNTPVPHYERTSRKDICEEPAPKIMKGKGKKPSRVINATQDTVAGLLSKLLNWSSNTAGFALKRLIEQTTGKKFEFLTRDKAKELGLTNSQFTDPAGTSNQTSCQPRHNRQTRDIERFIARNPNQSLASAADIARLMQAVAQKPTLRNIMLENPKGTTNPYAALGVPGKTGTVQLARNFTGEYNGHTITVMGCPAPTGRLRSKEEQPRFADGFLPLAQALSPSTNPN